MQVHWLGGWWMCVLVPGQRCKLLPLLLGVLVPPVDHRALLPNCLDVQPTAPRTPTRKTH